VPVRNAGNDAICSVQIDLHLQYLSNLASFVFSLLWRFSPLAFLWMTVTTACADELGPSIHSPPSIDQHADSLLVKFKPHVNQNQAFLIAESYGAREVLSLSAPGQDTANTPMVQWRRLRFDPHADLQKIMQRMAQDAGVETVELNQMVTIQKQNKLADAAGSSRMLCAPRRFL